MGDRNPKSIHKQTSQKQDKEDRARREKEEAILNKQQKPEPKK